MISLFHQSDARDVPYNKAKGDMIYYPKGVEDAQTFKENTRRNLPLL